jgi:crossover junction endodeoxyribonuclease RuvC
MRLLAIDPGGKGAIATLDDGGLTAVVDMPTFAVKVNGKDRTRIDIDGFVRVLIDAGHVSAVVVEGVGPMPRDGAVGAWNFGYSVGLLHGAIAALERPLHLLRPQSWRKLVDHKGGKDESRMLAKRLWPDHAALFNRVKDDGRAEASLIGLAYWRSL